MTYGEAYGPAMKITEQAEADAYFEDLVRWTMEHEGMGLREAEAQERANLGYYAGYYDTETRARVERLFRCAHPIFGAIAERGPPTPEEAFEAGRQLAAGTFPFPPLAFSEAQAAPRPSRRFDL